MFRIMHVHFSILGFYIQMYKMSHGIVISPPEWRVHHPPLDFLDVDLVELE